jgi:LacI family transcriptional regulator
MSKQKPPRISLTDVAKAAAVSKGAASLALHNRPGVSPATRERVLCAAKRLGYIPDARISSWMARVRDTNSKDLVPICWLNTSTEQDAWQKYKFLTPYLEAARERGLQLGYSLEEMWLFQPGMTMRRAAQILYQRGIEGVIVTQYVKHFRLEWEHLAAISIEGGIMAPRLHRVAVDFPFNFRLASKMVRRLGYQRVGVCLEIKIDRDWNRAVSAAIRDSNLTIPPSDHVAPLFYGVKGVEWQTAKAQVGPWLKRYKPEVILGHADWLVDCVEAAGFRVPEDIGVVHMATDDDVSDWAGVFSNKRAVGATAVDFAISCIRNRQFGIPETALNTLICGTWHPGRTLIPRCTLRPETSGAILDAGYSNPAAVGAQK